MTSYKCVAALVIGGLVGQAPAVMAQDGATPDSTQEKLREMEQRLDQAMELIQHLTAELTAMKGNAKTASAKDGVIEEVDLVDRQIADVTARLDDLEEAVVDVDERVGSRAVVQAFDAKSLDIGGFLLSTLTGVDGEDGSSASFNRLVFELLVSAQLSDNFSVFVAQAFTREASPLFIDPEGRRTPDFTLATGSPTPIAWANYRLNDAFNVRIGKWVTPHGIINIEHFPAILLDTEQPQFLRPFSGQTVFPNFQTGVQVHGKKSWGFGGTGQFSYDLYLANFNGNQDEFNFGGRVGYRFGESGLTTGVNLAFGRRNELLPSDYELYGIDVLYDKGPILWKSELFATSESLGGNRLAFYTQPAWRIDDQWTLFYRYDFLDDGALNGDRLEHVAGLAFNPLPNVRLRGTATFRHFDAGQNGFGEADARLYQLSTTYSF